MKIPLNRPLDFQAARISNSRHIVFSLQADICGRGPIRAIWANRSGMFGLEFQ